MPSDGRLRRFLHLERARPARPAADSPREGDAATGGRIAGLERPRAPAAGGATSRTGARLERFGPEREPSLELDETEGRRAFVRCHRCGGDSNVFATACQGCGENLDTPEQHEFDERFWAARQAEADQEARVAREREEQRARAEAEEAQARRSTAEALAREVGDAERRRLGALGDGARSGPWQPLGLRLVRRAVADERWHPLVLGLLAGLAAIVLGYGVHRGSGTVAVAGAVALIALLVHAPE